MKLTNCGRVITPHLERTPRPKWRRAKVIDFRERMETFSVLTEKHGRLGWFGENGALIVRRDFEIVTNRHAELLL